MYSRKSNIYCLNCGKVGHLQSRCLFPINSWGIICVSYIKPVCLLVNDITIRNPVDDNRLLLNKFKNDLKFILIKRKNSLCFVEFMRGRYYFDNLQYIHTMVSKMSIDEQVSLLKNSFNDLWCRMWNIETINKSHTVEYSASYIKFNKIVDGVTCYFNKKIPVFTTLAQIISNNKSIYGEPEWEIPKGRKNSKEDELDCSNREFFEETNISADRYSMVFAENHLTEKYIGSDGVAYKNNYFLAELNNINDDIKLDNTKSQLKEVSGIKLVSYNEAMRLIRDYSIVKKDILTDVLNIIYYGINVT